MHDVIIRQFGQGLGELRVFEKGSFEIITLGGITLGKAIYEPGWKWSEHVRIDDGQATCEVEHVVLVVEGQCAVAMDDGETTIMKPVILGTCRPVMTVGWWGMSRMSRFILWVRRRPRSNGTGALPETDKREICVFCIQGYTHHPCDTS